MVQNNLGNTLNTLGSYHNDAKLYEAAAEAFRAALEVRTRDSFPMQWAASQLNLGNTLNNVGKLEAGTASLELAATAYRDALTVFTRETAPFDWASAQNNLGSVLLTLGQRNSDVGQMRGSVGRASGQRWRNIRVPACRSTGRWRTSISANSLQLVGQFKDDPAMLKQAIAAYREALKEYRREDSPRQWALVADQSGRHAAVAGEL